MVGPRKSSSKAIAQPPKSQHITVIAYIGVDTAPVPLLILYKGATVQDS